MKHYPERCAAGGALLHFNDKIVKSKISVLLKIVYSGVGNLKTINIYIRRIALLGGLTKTVCQ